jgi:hypothetical protein
MRKVSKKQCSAFCREFIILVAGMALGLGEPEKPSSKFKKKVIVPSTSKEAIKRTDECELIFNLDEDHVAAENPAAVPMQVQSACPRPHSPLRMKIPQSKPHHVSLFSLHVFIFILFCVAVWGGGNVIVTLYVCLFRDLN